MTPYRYDEHEARHQDHERTLSDHEDRLAALEAGPYFCEECGGTYTSRRAAEACATEDRKPDRR